MDAERPIAPSESPPSLNHWRSVKPESGNGKPQAKPNAAISQNGRRAPNLGAFTKAGGPKSNRRPPWPEERRCPETLYCFGAPPAFGEGVAGVADAAGVAEAADPFRVLCRRIRCFFVIDFFGCWPICSPGCAAPCAAPPWASTREPEDAGVAAKTDTPPVRRRPEATTAISSVRLVLCMHISIAFEVCQAGASIICERANPTMNLQDALYAMVAELCNICGIIRSLQRLRVAEVSRRGALTLAFGEFAQMRIQIELAQPHGLGRHFHQFIVLHVGQGLLESQAPRRC